MVDEPPIRDRSRDLQAVRVTIATVKAIADAAPEEDPTARRLLHDARNVETALLAYEPEDEQGYRAIMSRTIRLRYDVQAYSNMIESGSCPCCGQPLPAALRLPIDRSSPTLSPPPDSESSDDTGKAP